MSSPPTPARTFTPKDADAVYALAQKPTTLGQQVKHALAVIDAALDRYGLNHLGLSFNGGKDCTVLIHLLAAAIIRRHHPQLSSASHPSAYNPTPLPPIQSVYIRCTSPFPQVEAFVTVCVDRYNLRLEVAEGNMRDALEEYLDKVKADAGEEGEIKAVLVGTRRNDPHGAKLKDFDPTDRGWPAFVRVHPILDWDYATIWDFLREPSLSLGEGNVEWCEMYNYGYTSLGSTHNTFPNPLLRSNDPKALDRWKPAWDLQDGSQERAGRETRPAVVEAASFVGEARTPEAVATPGVETELEAQKEVGGVNGR